MATAVYRFVRTGVNVADIQSNLPVGVTASIVNLLPKTWVDIQLDPDGPTAAADLQAFMTSMGWTLAQVNPPNPLSLVPTLQREIATLGTDQTINTPVWTELLSVNITTGTLPLPSNLKLVGTVSSEALGAPVLFRISVDGVPVAGASASHGVGTDSVSLVGFLLGSAPGVKNVKLEWSATAPGSANVLAASMPSEYSASLVAEEYLEM